ncbi:hypothetical protein HK405_010046 [Cladochytrium tenue]|nr:hypothetical protein HK405_010046 [Cladochytrium tenue]
MRSPSPVRPARPPRATSLAAVTTTAAASAALLVLAVAPAATRADCITLTGSASCPDWQAYQVYYNASSSPFDGSVSSFDSYIASMADNTSTGIAAIQNTYACPGFAGIGLRYHLTVLCGLFVDTATTNNGCNSAAGTVVTTCASSASAFLTSANAMFQNSSVCSQSPDSTSSGYRTVLVDTVSEFVTIIGNNAADCVLAVTGSAEATGCGYYDSAEALTFCQSNPSSTCCAKVAGFSASSTGSSSTTSATSTVTSQSASSSTSTTTTAVAASDTTATILGLAQPIFIGTVAGAVALLIAIVVGVAIAVGRSKNRKRELQQQQQQRSAGRTEFSGKPPGQFTGEPPVNGAILAASGGAAAAAAAAAGYYGNAPQDQWVAQQQQFGQPSFQDQQFQMQQLQMQQQQPPMGGIPLPAGLTGGGFLGDPLGGGATPVSETMETVFNYVPNLSDEIYLYVGDPVVVKCKFDDGWGYGLNVTTKMEGSFPLACVAPYAASSPGGSARGDEWLDGSGRSMNRASFSIRQRQSSMYGPPSVSSDQPGQNGLRFTQLSQF